MSTTFPEGGNKKHGALVVSGVCVKCDISLKQKNFKFMQTYFKIMQMFPVSDLHRGNKGILVLTNIFM